MIASAISENESESMFPAFLPSPASTLKQVHDFQNAHREEAGQTTACLSEERSRDANREASLMSRPTTTTALPSDTKVLSIGLHPSAPDYSRMLDGFDNEAILTARIEAGIAALRKAGFDAVPCLIDTSPDRAEAIVRELLQKHAFGLTGIGGGVRMVPENTLLFERLVSLLTEEAPGIRLCFNASPENTVEALSRWIQT
ncbi:hypothetical protein [Streptomyces sp. NPDC050528]|uniref:hypothetical protein n=1 Tax=Streptomyces sp. NPDC050528 TaxID=3365623 RepID=UPI0037959635